MSMSIKMEGLDELLKAIEEKGQEVKAQVEMIVEASASAIHGATVKRIQRGPASGEIYKSKVADRDHQASAPGQAPMSDSGRLVGSYSIIDGANSLTKYISSNVEYAYYLEFGTQNMEARPHLLPSVEEETPRFKSRLMKVLT